MINQVKQFRKAHQKCFTLKLLPQKMYFNYLSSIVIEDFGTFFFTNSKKKKNTNPTLKKPKTF